LATSQLIFKSKSPGFIERITTQTTPTPHSGTSNGVEGKKTIHKPLYLPNIASADYFLFLSAKLKLAGLSLSQESFK
jgi:hypothetical protein